jgi:threonine dehydratase
MSEQLAVNITDIEAAADRLAGEVIETPLIRNKQLDALLGARVMIKPEILQHGGAFKYRGAYNRLSQLSADEKTRGVVAFSSGNHAQGVALAAARVGCPALIVMPADSPKIKVDNTRLYGAEIRFFDRYTEDREAIAAEIAAERGCVVVPSYDDPHVIAGQGTVGLELVLQAKRMPGALPDMVICPVGGGGLISGVSTAVKADWPNVQVWGVEPAAFDDTQRSLASGERESNDPAARSFCDALQSPTPGVLTFPIMQKYLTGVVTVTDAEVSEAIRYAFNTLKLVVEPGGCVGLAALLAGKLDVKGKTVAVVLSGGNIDPELHAAIMAGRA